MNQKKRLLRREEVSIENQWRMEDLYSSDMKWEEDYRLTEELLEEFRNLQGTMGVSSRQFYEMLEKQHEIDQLLDRLYVYASQKNHEDMANAVYQKLFTRAQGLVVMAGDVMSFLEPELLAIPGEKLEQFFRETKELEIYRRFVEEQLRRKEHVLSKELEGVLAKAAQMGQGPQNIFQMFNNADLSLGEIQDEEGERVSLTYGLYTRFLECADRNVRKAAFTSLYNAYGQFRNTLAEIFIANLKQEHFFAEMRHYDSAREAALYRSHIPVEVYDKLIEAVHANLPLMYRYMKLRKRVLLLEQLHMYDIHTPLVAKVSRKYSFEEAKTVVLQGLAPLGAEYRRILEEGFQNRWIDVYENQGKRNGAYSWGAYGVHPYVLMNFNGTLNNVFTLAHEMGHAIHSYYSDKAQPYPYAKYRIFVAEVASTCNEALLIHYLMENAKDREEKAYLINYFLDQFRGTVFRQTMFAEFEKIVHDKVQQGEGLTADSLCSIYYELNRKYFGEDVISDREIEMEWSRIPHFYNSFYVYQYATGFSAAIAISTRILRGEDGIIEKYLAFLKGGSSMDCIDLLKICHVDMTSPEPVDGALKVFSEYLQKLEELI